MKETLRNLKKLFYIHKDLRLIHSIQSTHYVPCSDLIPENPVRGKTDGTLDSQSQHPRRFHGGIIEFTHADKIQLAGQTDRLLSQIFTL